MSNAWEKSKELAEKHAGDGSGLFVKLANDGDKIVGVFVGDPFPREVHWKDGYVECTGEGCALCKSDKKPAFRAAMNFFVPESNEMKIIEGGYKWFQDIIKVREKYGLDRWLFEIERKGEAKSTKTSYTILPEREIDQDLAKRILKTDQHKLKSTIMKADEEKQSGDNDKVIDSRTASAIVAQLKALPREEVDVFLSEFGLSRIRDIKQTDLKAANAFIEKLEKKYSQPETGNEEVDPFA